eukprot:scaffold104684_cov45-Attheya_sp.AAC.2
MAHCTKFTYNLQGLSSSISQPMSDDRIFAQLWSVIHHDWIMRHATSHATFDCIPAWRSLLLLSVVGWSGQQVRANRSLTKHIVNETYSTRSCCWTGSDCQQGL